MKRFKLVIEYDGSTYHGWQRQKSDNTIQAEIEDALAVMTRQKVTVLGAGRTDAGVHALGQVAHFDCDTRLSPDIFLRGLNSLLPDAIVIKSCEGVAPDFHARYHAKRKIYQYRILNRSVPTAINRHYTWHIRRPLNLGAMCRAAEFIVGTHDFKAFEGTGSPRSSTVRRVYAAGIDTEEHPHLSFTIEADGFLRFMVRNIVGTLVNVGLGKFEPEDLPAIIDSGERQRAGATAPPHGLFLVAVDY
jgi:tRNA pseudouridine38-40 synthase